MSARLTRSAGSLLLLAPLFLFLLFFFFWPLATMIVQAVSDSAVLRVLPQTSQAVAAWDRGAAPTPAMQAALIADLTAADDKQAIGDMVRRLNSAKAGFRSLFTRTLAALQAASAHPDLAEIDARWSQPEYWEAIADALPPLTDRYVLAAADLTRNGSGTIESLPAGTSANRAILLRTFWIGALVTFACIIIGFPYAMLIASATGWKRTLLLAAVLLPLWTSLLVRTAAWFIVLQENGLINEALQVLNIVDGPIPLIFNRTGVVIAMTHVLLPFMVLPVYSVLASIPTTLMPAAASLGAPPYRAFLRVLLPLSFRGLAAGALLVFMSALGYYITPALIGGPNDQMISSIIAFYATASANWGMAGALGLVLLIATLMLFAVYVRLSGESLARTKP